METYVGPATLMMTPAYTCRVTAAVTDADGSWEARVTPFAGRDLMNLEIGLETMPGPWELTFDGSTIWVDVHPAADGIYLLTRAGT